MSDIKVGIQVYGLRDMLEDTPENFENVMMQIKKLGYDGIELAGLYGIKPVVIREILEKIGLLPISAHVPLADMLADAEKVAKDYEQIGCKYIVIPYLPEEYRYPNKGYEQFVADVERIAETMQKHGLMLLYHNHNFEYVKMAHGKYMLDDMYDRIPAEHLQTELDLCWVKVAGEDPAEYIKKYTGRCPIVHYKDYIMEGHPRNLFKLIGIDTKEEEIDTGKFELRPVGFGQQLWEPIYEATKFAGAEWIVVEQDEHYELPSLECARRSIGYLRLFMNKNN